MQETMDIYQTQSQKRKEKLMSMNPTLLESMELTNADKGQSNAYAGAAPKTQKHQNVVEIIKKQLSQKRDDGEQMLKPTKAALFGIHVRFADMERRSKR